MLYLTLLIRIMEDRLLRIFHNRQNWQTKGVYIMAKNNVEIYAISLMHGGVHYFSRHYDFCYMNDGSVYQLSCEDDSWFCCIPAPCGLAF